MSKKDSLDDFLDDVEEAEAEELVEEKFEITDEAAELDALRAERNALQDKFMRVLADAENARKRSERERKEAENYGGSKLARDLLPVYDNMKRALEAAKEKDGEADAALMEGVELTMRELVSTFKKYGIERVSQGGPRH